jgi:glycosyltransferase involved in cell wall biosynthesis
MGHLRRGFDVRPAQMRRLLDAMRNADVLHVHDATPALLLAAMRSGTPAVYTEHGNFGFGRRRTWRDVVKDRIKHRFLNRHARIVTANSNYTLGVANERFGPLPHGRVVYNGLDTSRFDVNGARRDGRHEFVAGTIARLAGAKRIDRAIRGFARMSDVRGCRLVIAGGGPLLAEFQALARRERVADRVEFLGVREDVPELLAQMDVFLMPSENEPFGLAAVEALLAGRPVVAFADGGGLLEILRPIPEARIVEDETALAAELDAMRATPVRCSPQTLAAVREQFDIRRVAATFAEIYRSAVEA